MPLFSLGPGTVAYYRRKKKDADALARRKAKVFGIPVRAKKNSLGRGYTITHQEVRGIIRR